MTFIRRYISFIRARPGMHVYHYSPGTLDIPNRTTLSGCVESGARRLFMILRYPEYSIGKRI